MVALLLMARADVGRTASKQESNVDIVAINLQGRQTNLTHDPAFDVNPAVARDGRIVFLSTRDGYPDFYVMDGNGRNVRRLTNGALDDSAKGSQTHPTCKSGRSVASELCAHLGRRRGRLDEFALSM